MNLKSKFFEKRNHTFRVSIEDNNAPNQLGAHILNLLPTSLPICIICIGSDRSTGDALGPIVGSNLMKKTLSQFHIYGTLDDPIHAVNLEEKLLHIKSEHPSSYILAIDACLGRLKSIGFVSLSNEPLKPGAGVNKTLPPVGDAHISGIVNVSGFMEYMVLQNTRLSFVMNMAEVISRGIYLADQAFSIKQLQSNFQKSVNDFV